MDALVRCEAACNGLVNRRAAKRQRAARFESNRWLCCAGAYIMGNAASVRSLTHRAR